MGRLHTRLTAASVFAACFGLASEASAWKPKTHVYLAEQAIKEALEKGTISIYATDFAQGKVTSQKIGDFAVDPEIRRAIQGEPDKYFAGVLGPDAYPDVLTGQMRIHPPGPHSNPNGSGCDGPDEDCDGAGTDAWLRGLWAAAWGPQGHDAEKAFAAGYLAHAAGDMYAHTFMNRFTGGIFDIKTLNGIRHVTLEGYIGERTPEFDVKDADLYNRVLSNGVTGIEHFIIDNLTDVSKAREGEASKKLSVPWLLYAARAWIQTNIDAFNRDSAALYRALQDAQTKRNSDWLIAYCSTPFRNDPTTCARVPLGDGRTCSLDGSSGLPTCFDAGRATEYAGHLAVDDLVVLPAGQLAYVVHEALGFWIPYAHDVVMTNLDRARYDWVTTSNRVAYDLFFNRDQETKFSEAAGEVKQFTGVLLARVMGVPDSAINDALYALGLADQITHAIDAWKDDLLDTVLWKPITGYTKDQVKGMYAKPHAYLDQVFQGATTVASINDILHVSKPTPTDGDAAWAVRANVERFNVDPTGGKLVFAAAYNTVLMIKLSLLSNNGLNDLLTRLGLPAKYGWRDPQTPPPIPPVNAMLGYLDTIDGSNQWAADLTRQPAKPGMFLWQNCAFRRIFLPQEEPVDAGGTPIGRRWEPVLACNSVAPTPLNITPGSIALGARGHSDFTVDAPSSFLLDPLTGSLQVGYSLAHGPGMHGPTKVTYNAPDSVDKDETITLTAQGLGGGAGGREGWATINLLQDVHIAPMPSGKKSAPAIAHVDLRGGESRRFVIDPAIPAAWRVVSGPGKMGPPAPPQYSRGGAMEGIDKRLLATYEAQLQAAIAAHKGCGSAKNAQCTGAFEGVRAAVMQRDLFVQKGLDALAAQAANMRAVASTYYAPPTVNKEEKVTIEAKTEDGRTATLDLWLEPPPRQLSVTNLPKAVLLGQSVQLTVSEPVAMQWTVVSGEGTLGDPQSPQRAQLIKTQLEPFQAKLKELQVPATALKLSRASQTQKTELDVRHAEVTTKLAALNSHIKANADALGRALQQIAVMDGTYHAPAALTASRTVTIRGTAQDGSGRTVMVTLPLLPK